MSTTENVNTIVVDENSTNVVVSPENVVSINTTENITNILTEETTLTLVTEGETKFVIQQENIDIKQISIGLQGPSGPPGNSVELYTTERLLIQNNKIVLPYSAMGGVVWDIGLIFDTLMSNVFFEATCVVNVNNKQEVLFDSLDLLNEKYCVVSYIKEVQ